MGLRSLKGATHPTDSGPRPALAARRRLGAVRSTLSGRRQRLLCITHQQRHRPYARERDMARRGTCVHTEGGGGGDDTELRARGAVMSAEAGTAPRSGVER